MNERLNLNGTWNLAVDPENRGVIEEWFQERKAPEGDPVVVPGIVQRHHPGFNGAAWYFLRFHAPPIPECRDFLLFEAVNQACDVYLNDEHVGSSETGYLPFEFEITDRLRAGENFLAVRTLDAPRPRFPGDSDPLVGPDGMILVEMPCGNEAEGHNFQGIWGGVDLLRTGGLRIRRMRIIAPAEARHLKVDVWVDSIAEIEDARWEFALRPAGRPDSVFLAAHAETAVKPGRHRFSFEFDVEKAEPWSLSNPRLYAFEATCAGSDRIVERFGFRTVGVRGNGFILNGERIPIRGVTLPTAYPRNLAFPDDPGRVREEIEAIKNAGFNAVRTWLRPALTGTLDAADEAGLLVYEEPAIGRIRFSSEIERRCIDEVEDLVKRDINHPSVAFWGILNETGTYLHRSRKHPLGALTFKRELVARIQRLDPTRIVIDDSGGQVFSRERSRVFAPGLSEEGVAFQCRHMSASIPPSRTYLDHLDETGSDDEITLLASLGCPVFADPVQAAAGYTVADEGLECLDRFRQEAAGLAAWLRHADLNKEFRDTSAFASALWPASAAALEKLLCASRMNRRIAGFFLRSWADCPGDAGSGLVDPWGRPKPPLAAVRKSLASEALSIDVMAPNPRLGEEFEVEVFFLNDGPFRGRGRLVFSLAGTELGRREIEIGEEASLGRFQFRNDSVQGTCEMGVVLIREDRASLSAVSVMHFEGADSTRADRGRVQLFARSDHPLYEEFQPLNLTLPGSVIILVPQLSSTMFAYPDHTLREVLKKVFNGSVAVFFDVPPDTPVFFHEVVDLEMALIPADPGPLGIQHLSVKGVLFEGLRANAGLGPEYARVAPKYSFRIKKGEDLALAFSQEERGREDTPLSDVKAVSYGQGWILFSSYRLLGPLSTDSCAQRLLENHIRCAARYLKSSPRRLDESNSKHLARLARHRSGGVQEWTVLSPPIAGDPCANFRRVFPIEVNPTGEYAGIQCHTSRGMRAVDLGFFFPFATRHITFLYTDIDAKRAGPKDFYVGASNGVKLWINGELVFNLHKHQSTMETPNLIRAPLSEGPNRIFVKVENFDSDWEFLFVPAQEGG